MDDLDITELETLLQEQIRSLGPDHPDALMTRHVLARCIAAAGQYEHAASLYEELVRDRSRILGPQHRDTFSSRHNLALARANCGQFDTAISEFLLLSDEIKAALGAEDPDVFHTRQQLAVVLGLAGRRDEAMACLLQLLTDIGRAGHPFMELMRETRRLMSNLEDAGIVWSRNVADDEAEEIDTNQPVIEYPKEIKLGRALANRAAAILGRNIDAVVQELGSDARMIAERVGGGCDPVVASALFSSLGIDPVVGAEHQYLEIVRELVESQESTAGRIASQIALAYVDLAHVAASIDSKWDDPEVEAIDVLRSDLRRILGNRMDTTSDEALEFEKQFEDIVGLQSVKQALLGFVNVLIENRRRSQRGGELPQPRLHLAFSGNPGTGKTSIARLYGQLLSRLGILEGDSFIEVDKSSLVAEHLGQTEIKVARIVDQADPGVLFIDEAYGLNDSHDSGKGYGEVALEVIIKAMEDRRGTLAVVLAGYQREIEDLMKVNPGLRSRLAAIIEFPDFSTEELLEIAKRVGAKRSLRFDDGALQKLASSIEMMRSAKDFGNARDVENLVDEAFRNQTLRLAPLDDLATESERRLVIADDIPSRFDRNGRKPIGFATYL